MKIQDLAEKIGARVVHGGEIEVRQVSAVDSAVEDALVFVEDPKYLNGALVSSAAAVVAGEFAASAATKKALLICAQPKLAFSRAAKVLHLPEKAPVGAHPTAIVDQAASLRKGASVGAYSFIDGETLIGERSRVGRNCSIGKGTQIGADSVINDNVTVYPGTKIGDRTVVHSGVVLGSDGFGYVRHNETGKYEQFPQIGWLEIGDDVEIGANTTIDRGALGPTVISDGVKIDNLVHVGHNVRIGKNVVIAAQTGISGSVVIEDDVVFAGQVGIGDHAHIEEGVILGGQGGVLPHKVIRGKGVLFWGTPVRPVKEYLKEVAFISRLARKSSEKKPKE